MHYCTKCGNPVTNPVNFCTRCGAPLPKSLAAQPETAPKTGPKSKFNSLYIIIPLLIIVAGTAIYLLTNKKNEVVASNETPLPAIDTMVSSQEIIVDTAAAVDTYSEFITQSEEAELRNTITGFYQSENDQEVGLLLGYYEFPIIRYYEMTYVSYEQLEKMVNDAFNGSLFYHKMEINWNNTRYEKINNNLYRVFLSGLYSSGSRTDEYPKQNSLNLVIELNSFYKITSIFKDRN